MTSPSIIDDELNNDYELPFEQFLTYRIHALASRMNKQAIQMLDETCGLRLPEWRCMAMIGRRGQLNLFSISDIAGMDRGQVTRSVQGLVEKGHVVTKRDSKDRRIVLAMLTQKGRGVFRKTFPIMERRQLRLLSSLSTSDQKAFYRIMDRLSNSVVDWEREHNQQ